MTDRTPTPPLTPLEEQLDRLLLAEIERQDAARLSTRGARPDGLEEIPMDLDDIRRSHCSVREVESLRKALRNLCLAVEDLLLDEKTCDLQDHYEVARAAIGEPVVLFDGGPEGDHFHFLEFDPEADCCCYCEEHDRSQEPADATTGR